MAQDADQGYNPASAVKLGTALTALKSLGVDYRFPTAVWTNAVPEAEEALEGRIMW